MTALDEWYSRDHVIVPEEDAGSLVIILVSDRAEFERIAARSQESNDRYGHCLRKNVRHRSGRRMLRITFTHWIKRP